MRRFIAVAVVVLAAVVGYPTRAEVPIGVAGPMTGPAAEGTLFAFVPDPRRNAEAAPVVERFRAKNFEPEGYTLLTYGAVQVWAQAVEKARLAGAGGGDQVTAHPSI